MNIAKIRLAYGEVSITPTEIFHDANDEAGNDSQYFGFILGYLAGQAARAALLPSVEEIKAILNQHKFQSLSGVWIIEDAFDSVAQAIRDLLEENDAK